MVESIFASWTNKQSRQFTFTLFSIFLIVILAMVFMVGSLKWVGADGCLRSHCNYSRFKDEYRNIIDVKCG